MAAEPKQAETAEEKEERSQDREYIVLGATPDGDWKELGTVTARSDKKAIEPYVEKGAEHPVFVAIPKRSWNPRKKPKAESKLKLTW